jgi:hypothetical protein
MNAGLRLSLLGDVVRLYGLEITVSCFLLVSLVNSLVYDIILFFDTEISCSSIRSRFTCKCQMRDGGKPLSDIHLLLLKVDIL